MKNKLIIEAAYLLCHVKQYSKLMFAFFYKFVSSRPFVSSL